MTGGVLNDLKAPEGVRRLMQYPGFQSGKLSRMAKGD